MFLERKSMQTLPLGLVPDPRPSLEGDAAACIDACSPLAPWQQLDAPGGPGAEAVPAAGEVALPRCARVWPAEQTGGWAQKPSLSTAFWKICFSSL